MIRQKETRLIVAGIHGDLDTIKKCLTASFLSPAADINVQNKDGLSVLSCAVGHRHTETVRFLIKRGADVNLADRKNGETPLMMAALGCELPILDLLLDAGADVNAVDKQGHSALWHMSRGLMSREHQIPIIRRLVERGANPNVEKCKGRPFLEEAIENKNEDLAITLVQNGADVNLIDKNGNTSLIAALNAGMENLAKELINHGADIHVKGQNDDTAMLAAARAGFPDVVRMLDEKGASLTDVDDKGAGVVMQSVWGGNLSVLEYLIDKKADINIRMNNGDTPFLQAAGTQRSEMLRCLAEHGADINVQNADGDTAFILAAHNGNLHELKVLRELGADITVQNNWGLSAFMAAAINKKIDVVNYFVDAGMIQYNPEYLEDAKEKSIKPEDVLKELKTRTVEQLVKLPEENPALWKRTIALRQLSVLIQLLPSSEHIKIFEKAQGMIDREEKEALKQLIRLERGSEK